MAEMMDPRRHAPARPRLEALLAKARTMPSMTPGERRAQCVSFVYGQLKFSRAALTREDVARAYDEMYGSLDAPG